MSDEKREDLDVDPFDVLGPLKTVGWAKILEMGAKDAEKVLAATQAAAGCLGDWLDKCFDAAKKIGEATQDARERLADLECRIATLENAVAELRTVDPPTRWRSLPEYRPDGEKEDA